MKYQIPAHYGLFLRDWWEHGEDTFVTEFIDALVAHDLPRGTGISREDLRDAMQAFLDKAYEPDVRHLAPTPTQYQINIVIEALLAKEKEDPVIYEQEGLIYEHRNDIEEYQIEKDILSILGANEDGPAS
jgi:hypothetical protein